MGQKLFSAAMAAGATLLALALIAAPAQAQRNKHTITTIRVTVTVKNQHGKPLQDALVVLKQLRDHEGRIPHNPFNINIHTNSHGQATVQGFEPGVVLVQVIDTAYQTWGQAFIMKQANESVYVKLKPPQAQISTMGKGKGSGPA
ncbi:MAG: hypothetical protein ACRD04_03405 [Terriglobales bacterium]